MNAKWLLLSRLFLFFVVLMFFSTFSTLTRATITENSNLVTSDRLALLAIKSKIKHDPNHVLSSWNHSSPDFCQWRGVTCSARHQRVAVLDLSFGGLTGTLSPFIGNLSFIRSIFLLNNSFSSEIPPEIGRLFRLRSLILSLNSFSGNIPTTITNCSNLEDLILGSNSLGGKIPKGIGSLSMLKSLFLSQNVLEGEIPLFIANLTMLQQLSLSDCQLGGSFKTIFQLKNLRILSLDGNNLVGTIPASLYNRSSLRIIELDNNKLTGRLRLDLGSTMPYLSVFTLSNNRLTHLVKSNTSISSPIKILDISRNRIQGTYFGKRNTSIFISMANLTVLDISHNYIRGMLNILGIHPRVQIVDLSSNELSGSLDHFLCSYGVKDTRVLYLRNNHFSGFIPECWEKWRHLQILNLENNNLFGEIPTTLPFLQLLNLRGNNFSGKLPSSLMNLSQLEVLQLGENELVGSIPTWIGIKLTLLKVLNLRFNKFYGSIPHQLCYLSHIQILDLAHNKLSGSIPRCFNNFSIFSGIKTNSPYGWNWFDDSLVIKGQEYRYEAILSLVRLLDLSSNNISGQIPSELTTLHKLESLNLSRNQLSGRIPEKIGDMNALQSFDLSLNKLSGEIPTSLSKLNFLSSFNVSYNNLTGRVPTGTQIQSFNESSFVGNKLCGAPLASNCVPLEVPGTKGDKKENEDNPSDGTDWGLIISIVLGFINGFWIIMISLIVSTSWRFTFFSLLSKLIKCYA